MLKKGSMWPVASGQFSHGEQEADPSPDRGRKKLCTWGNARWKGGSALNGNWILTDFGH